MRIVADTNTVLSGLLWQGAPRRLLDLARERKITLCTSLVLLAELAEVMTRTSSPSACALPESPLSSSCKTTSAWPRPSHLRHFPLR